MNPVETARGGVSPYNRIDEKQKNPQTAGQTGEAEKADSAKETTPVSGLRPESGGKEEPRAQRPPRYDEYVRGDSEPVPNGDEKKPDGGAAPEGEMCTVNTDRVDKEIRKLKEELKKLEQEAGRMEPDDEQRAALEKRRDSIEAQLGSKDNDSYRKQHASVTNG